MLQETILARDLHIFQKLLYPAAHSSIFFYVFLSIYLRISYLCFSCINNLFHDLKIYRMKILVCISKTPDTTAKIAFTNNNTKFAADGVQWIINPYDEWYALVRAIELKEAD